MVKYLRVGNNFIDEYTIGDDSESLHQLAKMPAKTMLHDGDPFWRNKTCHRGLTISRSTYVLNRHKK